MAYNTALYQNTPYTGANNYPMNALYNNANMNGVNQSAYPQFVTPPNTLTATYIKGEIGASGYPVGYGNTVVLLDSDTIDTDNPIIYIKSTGYDGKSQSFKKISGTVSYPNEQGLFTTPVKEVVKEIEKADVDLSSYATKEDLKEIKENIDFVSTQIDEYEKALNKITETVSSIDNRFSNMFSAFNNNSINVEEKGNENPNQRNNKNKGNFKKGDD